MATQLSPLRRGRDSEFSASHLRSKKGEPLRFPLGEEKAMISKRMSSPFQDPAMYLPLIYLCLSFPLFALRRDFTGEVVGEVDFTALLISYIIVAAVSAGMCRYKSVLKNFLSPGDLLLFAFISVILASVFVHESLDPFLQVGLLLVVLLGIRTISMSARFFTGLQMASVLLLVFMLTAIIILGPPVHRRLGGIHPNAFGGIALTCTFLATFGSQRRFEITAAICLSCALLVSSRYSMVGITLLYSVYWLLNIRRAGLLRVSFAVIATFALAVDFFFSAGYGFIGNALELNNSHRGLSSGLTGRDETWSQMPIQFSSKPLFGYGFRDRASYVGAHNAFLNVILENGLLGSVPFFSFYLYRLISLTREALTTSRTTIRGRYLAGLIAFTFGAMLQPQAINFGDSFGYTMLLLMFSAPGAEKAASAHAVKLRLGLGKNKTSRHDENQPLVLHS